MVEHGGQNSAVQDADSVHFPVFDVILDHNALRVHVITEIARRHHAVDDMLVVAVFFFQQAEGRFNLRPVST